MTYGSQLSIWMRSHRWSTASAIAAALSQQLSYGSIYTTKLLRRGIDIERPRTTNLLQRLTVADVMHPFHNPTVTHGSSDHRSPAANATRSRTSCGNAWRAR